MIEDDSNTFNEELEKELQSGLHNTLDESQGQDFTVKVHREEYVVKRRFYDKDKALETAEDLRKDKRNVVEDNLEGQILSSSDGDEDVDWDKLVDAGLQFDPPIAEAAAPKPGEEPVGLITPSGSSTTDENHESNDVNLEKTFLVKTKPVAAREEKEDTFNLEVEQEVEDIVVEEDEDEDENTEEAIEEAEDSQDETGDDPEEEAREDEEPETKKNRTSRYTPPVMPPLHKKPSKVKPALVAVLVLLVLAGGFFVLKKDKTTPDVPAADPTIAANTQTAPMPVPDSSGTAAAPTPAPSASPEAVPAQSEKAPAVSGTVPPVTSSAPGFVATTGPLPYAVHSGSYRLSQEAANAVSGFRQKGITAFTAFVSLADKGEWYRIYAGCYATLEEASAAASHIKQTTGEDALSVKAPWSIQVGKAVPESKAAKVIEGLTAKGFTPYAVSDPGVPGGSVRFFIGAFTAAKDAGPMVDMLKKEGFKTSVVRR